jgi:hypothetical protein
MASSRRKDAVGRFLRESGCVRFKSTGYVSVVTADGQTLGIVNPTGYNGKNNKPKGLHEWLVPRLEDWQKLPAKRRQPGAVKVADLDEIDPAFAALRPPEGALIVRVTNRTMQHDEQGQPRLLCSEDLDLETSDIELGRLRDPANDFMWIPQAEWQALFDVNPRVGQSQVVPESRKLRVFGHHMNPNLGIQGSRAYKPRSLQMGEMTATVEEVTANSVRLGLAGTGVLDAGGGMDTRLIYRPALLGHLTYDRQKRTVTELEMVALGSLSGRLHRSPAKLFSEKPRLLGIVYELIHNPTGGERLRPNAARMQGSKPLSNYHNYLNPKANY